MSEQPSHNLRGLDIELARLIDAVCRQFEADRRAGKRPSIADYLGGVHDEGRPALRAELEALVRELDHSEETDTEAPTITPGSLPTSPNPGEARASVHDQATMLPRGDATVDLGQAASVHPDETASALIRYFGDYEIVREIARGGMGVVFQARQVSLNRKVALKMILAGQLADQMDVRRFYTEAEAAANLDHPGIVPIFEVGQHEGQHYFSMGFVEGKSLSQRLAEGPLPAREAAELIRRVSEAIEYAHQRGVIHRDLKPANILLDQNGNPRVTDFGLAKKVQGDSGLTGSGQIMGTPSYMPPEQAGGKRGDVGPASDVYALGATLYALVTGRPPFQAATAMDTVIQVISDEPVPPRRLNASIPRDLETVCLKCLEKEPGKRYGSAASLGEDLRRFLAGEPITARPVGTLERTWRWCKRQPKLAAALGAAAVGLLSVVGLSSLLGMREYRNAQALRQEKSATEKALRTVQQQRDDAQSRLYVFNMREVERAWDEMKVGGFWEKLDKYGPGSPSENLRGFEWYYWQKRAEGRARLTGFTEVVVGLGIDARREEVLAVQADGRVSAHPLGGGAARDLFRLEAGTKIKGAAFDGALGRVALGLSGGHIQVWDLAIRQAQRTIETGGELSGTLRFSPDGRMLAASSQASSSALSDGISVWEVSSGRCIFERPNTPAFIAFSPDGRTMAFSGILDTGLRLIDLASGRASEPFGLAPGFVGGMPAFCAGGSNVVQGGAMVSSDGTSGGRLMLWKVADKSVLATRDKLPWSPSDLVPSPDGRQLAIAGLMDGIVHLWDARLASEQHRLTGTRNEFSCELVYSTDGRLLGVGAADRTVSVWDTRHGHDAVTLRGHGRSVSGLAYVGRGIRLATSSWDGTIKLWDPVSGTATATFVSPKGPVVAVAASADGRFVAGAVKPNEVLVWDTTTAALHATFPAPTGDFTRLKFAPDNRTLALASGKTGSIPIWDVIEKRALPELRGGEQPFSAIAFSPDGSRLAAGQDIAGSYRIADGVTSAAILEWDIKSGQLLRQLRGHIGPIRGLAYRGDGHLLASGSEDATIRLWNADDGALLQTLSGHTHGVQSVAFSPDGRRLASGAGSPAAVAPEQELKLWDVSTGMETLNMPGHTMGVCAVAFRPDGGQLASASADGTIKLWDATPLTSEQKTLRAALNLVESLFDQKLPIAEILSRIRQDSTISAQVSRHAQDLAEIRSEAIVNDQAERLVTSLFDRLSLKEDVVESLRVDVSLGEPLRKQALVLAERSSNDPNRLNEASWNVARWPGAEAAAYSRSLRVAEAACRLSPDNVLILNTLGVAQYRAGKYVDAAATLSRSDAFNSRAPGGPQPADLAFLAMSQSRLRQTERARDTMKRLREAMKKTNWAKNWEAQLFWREAETVQMDLAFPDDPFARP